jgi:hypothetical protein
VDLLAAPLVVVSLKLLARRGGQLGCRRFERPVALDRLLFSIAAAFPGRMVGVAVLRLSGVQSPPLPDGTHDGPERQNRAHVNHVTSVNVAPIGPYVLLSETIVEEK